MKILILLLLNCIVTLCNAQVCEPEGFIVNFIKTPNNNSLCDYEINATWDSWGDGETFVMENTESGCSNQVPISDGEIELICEADCNVEICFIISVLNTNNEICFQKTECLSPPLPIELISFKGNVLEDNKVQLVWSTASEEDNKEFQIEHSTDGLTWNTIDFIQGAGTTSTIRNYKYIHDKPSQGDNYYRLKQIDYSGKINITIIIVVKVLSKLKVYPNPVGGNFINYFFMGEVHQLDISQYPTGLNNYILKIPAGSDTTISFIKVK
jgi:hypothetical protein